jgi:3-isopropylmalate/(R)-2-methylmalate dehydratase large subunit
MMGMTIVEKILSQKNLTGASVRAGDLVDCRIDGIMVHNSYNYAQEAYERLGFAEGPPLVWDKSKVYMMLEHHQPAPTIEYAARNKTAKEFAQRMGLKYFYQAECGICHQMMFDYGHVRPGELIAGTDSHTLIYGALNAAGAGIGGVEAAYAMTFGELWFQVPETIKIVLKGKLPNYPIAKEIILALAGRYGDDFAQYQAIEYTGPVVSELSLDSRMCLAGHGVEVGAKFAFFDADEKALDYVRARTELPFEPVVADKDAEYIQEIEIDVGEVGFVVARPHRFDNVVPVEEAAGVKIDQALIGSCCNGRFEDIELVARVLKGKKIHPDVRLFIMPASWTIWRQCMDAGLMGPLLESGAQVQAPGCWVCEARGSVLADEEVCISSTTRNYRGRKGNRNAEIYLGGPATVAAAAIAGEIIHPKEVFDGFEA